MTSTVRFHLCEVPRIIKCIKPENRIVVTRGCRRDGNKELLFIGYRVSVWDDKKPWEMDSDDGCTIV